MAVLILISRGEPLKTTGLYSLPVTCFVSAREASFIACLIEPGELPLHGGRGMATSAGALRRNLGASHPVEYFHNVVSGQLYCKSTTV
jgi:hypothetical protein